MKKMEYRIMNKRGGYVDSADSKAEAEAIVARGARRGWAWNIVEIEHNINENPADWEMDGFNSENLINYYNPGEWIGPN